MKDTYNHKMKNWSCENCGMIAEDLGFEEGCKKIPVSCLRCNDNGCPACDTANRGSKYNPEPY